MNGPRKEQLTKRIEQLTKKKYDKLTSTEKLELVDLQCQYQDYVYRRYTDYAI